MNKNQVGKKIQQNTRKKQKSKCLSCPKESFAAHRTQTSRKNMIEQVCVESIEIVVLTEDDSEEDENFCKITLSRNNYP